MHELTQNALAIAVKTVIIKLMIFLKVSFFMIFLKKLKVKHSFIIGKVKERGIKKGKGEQGEAPAP